MNRLLTFLTAAGCAALLASPVRAMPTARLAGEAAAPVLRVQLGNGGPIGGGPNGSGNGTGSGLGNGASPGTGTGGGPAAGTGTRTGLGTGGGVGGGPAGSGTAGGLRPNGSGGQPNGSKPAPMQANGVRKVQ